MTASSSGRRLVVVGHLPEVLAVLERHDARTLGELAGLRLVALPVGPRHRAERPMTPRPPSWPPFATSPASAGRAQAVGRPLFDELLDLGAAARGRGGRRQPRRPRRT